MLREFLLGAIVPLYILWGATWAIVLRYYAEAAYVSWRQSGGHFLSAPRELYDLSTCLLLGIFRSPDPEKLTRYTAGHMLQLGVAMSSVSSALFGLLFWDIDRSRYPIPLLLCVMLAVNISMLGGLVHLHAPMRLRRDRWWKVYFFMCFTIPVMVGLYVLGT